MMQKKINRNFTIGSMLAVDQTVCIVLHMPLNKLFYESSYTMGRAAFLFSYFLFV